MLRWVILAVAVVFLTAAATLVPLYLPDPAAAPKAPVNESTGPQPKVEIDQNPIYEFGKMSQHDKGMHTWRIKNTGEADLELWMKGKPTCSCTIAKLENNQKAVVQPGKSTTIDLEWNTKDFHDDYSQGAEFGTNDPLHPTFYLTIKGKVHPPVVVYPPEMIQFPTISNEETQRRAIAIFSADRPKLKVTKVTSSRPDVIVATVKPMTPEEAKPLKVEAGYQILIEIKPGMPQGQFLEELVIRTDHPKRPEVRVSMGGKVIGPDQHLPPRVADARRHEPGGGFTRPHPDGPRGKGNAFPGGVQAGEHGSGDRVGRPAGHERPLPREGHGAPRDRGHHRRRDRLEDRPSPCQRSENPGGHPRLAVGFRLRMYSRQ